MPSWLDLIFGSGGLLGGGGNRLPGGAPSVGGSAVASTTAESARDPAAGLAPSIGTMGGAPGSGASSIYDLLYGSPEYKRTSLSSALMSAGANMLKASGPSTTPTSFGQVLGTGLSGAQQSVDTTRDRFARDLLIGSQFDTQRRQAGIAQGWWDEMRRRAGNGGQGAAPSGAGGGRAPDGGPGPHPNNPGNLIAQGGGFQAFDTPQAGVAELARTVQNYPRWFNNGQPMTLQQIAMRAAPQDDGRNPMLRGNNPQQWARNVAAVSGLPVDQPLDLTNPQTMLALTRGWHAAEKGQAAAFAPDVYQQGVQTALAQRGIAPVGAADGRQPQTAGIAPVGGAGLTVPRPQSAADLREIPRGTQYFAPDGSLRIRQ